MQLMRFHLNEGALPLVGADKMPEQNGTCLSNLSIGPQVNKLNTVKYFPCKIIIDYKTIIFMVKIRVKSSHLQKFTFQ